MRHPKVHILDVEIKGIDLGIEEAKNALLEKAKSSAANMHMPFDGPYNLIIGKSKTDKPGYVGIYARPIASAK